MSKVISFANQKGGIGKTTSAINISAAIGSMGRRVLLVDMDPQGNTTSGVGINKKNMRNSIYDILIGRCTAGEAVVQTDFAGLSIIPANISLAGAEFELVSLDERENRLRDALATLREDYDFIFIDCPPSLGILTINALTASDGVIIPMQCEYFALEGLSQLTYTIKQIKRLYNPKLELVGILVTMYNARLNLTLQVLDELKKYYADKLFSTTVVRNVRLSEAPSYGQPILYYDKFSKGSKAYMDVAIEVLERI